MSVRTPNPPIVTQTSNPRTTQQDTSNRTKYSETTDRMSSNIGYIWPKDPQPGNPRRWSRWKRFTDVLTGKGPDMYVGRIGPRTDQHHHREYNSDQHTEVVPYSGAREQRSRTGWWLWEKDHLRDCRILHCTECYRIREKEKRDNILRWARRRPEERYDFRTRRYQVPDEGTWSAVVYCDERQHRVPRRYWDRYGREYPAEVWHDFVHGAHEDRYPEIRY
ncbi:hypothetical protein BJX76DRAFT_354479 [Aspergillus varians]